MSSFYVSLDGVCAMVDADLLLAAAVIVVAPVILLLLLVRIGGAYSEIKSKDEADE
jgi:hypothetical protein